MHAHGDDGRIFCSRAQHPEGVLRTGYDGRCFGSQSGNAYSSIQ